MHRLRVWRLSRVGSAVARPRLKLLSPTPIRAVALGGFGELQLSVPSLHAAVPMSVNRHGRCPVPAARLRWRRLRRSILFMLIVRPNHSFNTDAPRARLRRCGGPPVNLVPLGLTLSRHRCQAVLGSTGIHALRLGRSHLSLQTAVRPFTSSVAMIATAGARRYCWRHGLPSWLCVCVDRAA